MDSEILDQITQKVTEIESLISSGSSTALSDIFSDWPKFVGAFGILVLGWLFGSLIEKMIMKIVNKLKFEVISEKLRFQEFLSKAQIQLSPAEIVVKFLKGYIFMMFFLASATLLGLTYVQEFLNSIIEFLPKVAVALFVILIGFRFANTTSALVENTLKITDDKSATLMSGVARYIIITFTVIAALNMIEIAEGFVNILFIGVVSTLSLGLGLAFGIGGSKFVANRLEEFVKKTK